MLGHHINSSYRHLAPTPRPPRFPRHELGQSALATHQAEKDKQSGSSSDAHRVHNVAVCRLGEIAPNTCARAQSILRQCVPQCRQGKPDRYNDRKSSPTKADAGQPSVRVRPAGALAPSATPRRRRESADHAPAAALPGDAKSKSDAQTVLKHATVITSI